MGNMAQALAQGFLKTGIFSEKDITAFAPNQEKLAANAKKIGFTAVSTLKEVAAADTVFIACKPHQVESVISDIKNELEGKALVSIALGWNFEKLSKITLPTTRIQFIMPNTPAMVAEGVFLFEKTNSLFEEERKELFSLFGNLGLVEELPDNLMGIGGAISGCGPAFVDLFIEAYSDAAVKYGIPRTTAYRLVSQTVLGSAKLQRDTEIHPAVLKDNVCSPGGSTIKGVCALENAGFRTACIQSVDKIMEK